MPIQVLEGTGGPFLTSACLWDTVSDFAFGPMFQDADEATEFLGWLAPRDPRDIKDGELETLLGDYRVVRTPGTVTL